MRNCFRKYGCIWVLLVCLNCMHVNKASGQQYFLKNYSLSDGLAGISVSSIIQDSRGYIWIGTMDGGLSRFDGKTFVNYTKHDGIGDNAITCLYEDRSGNIWIGTENNGVTKFNGLNSNTSMIPVLTLSTKSIATPPVISSFIRSLISTRLKATVLSFQANAIANTDCKISC